MTVVSPRTPTETGLLFSGPPRYEPGTPWGPWGALAATLLIFLGQLLGVAVIMAVYVSRYGTGEFSADMDPAVFFSFASPLGVATMIASQLGSILVVWLLAGRQKRRADTLAFSAPRPSLATCIAGGLIVIMATGVIEVGLYQLFKESMHADTKFIAEGLNSRMWWGTILVAVVFAPLWEELTFRGFLLSALAQTRLGFWGAALVCNIIWTALHAQYGWAGIGSVFTAGLVLSWLLWRTGSIRAPIIAHGIANMAAVIVAYLFNPAMQAIPT
jgi:uncharacterized protein